MDLYKPALVKVRTDIGTTMDRWFVLEEGIPMFEANEWLERKGLSTAKKYSTNLSRYLNFLEMRGKKYSDAKSRDIILFIDYILYGDMGNLKYINKDGMLTYSTLSGYLTTITEFYRFLEEDIDIDESNDTKWMKKKKLNAKKHYLYGQIWSIDVKVIIKQRIKTLKESKEYTKWYTDREEESLKTNFNNLRDQAVFMCTLDGGMRIDEALSIRLQDYDSNEMTVRPFRSKGKHDGQGRIIVLKEKTCNLIDRYIWNERAKAESDSGKYSDSLFINIKKGKDQGDELSYKNYLLILKSCAKRAGIEPEKIRTHSGRSSKTMRLLAYQAEHKDFTDGMINRTMGWTNSSSIEPYRNNQDVRLALLTAKKIQNGSTEEQNDGINK